MTVILAHPDTVREKLWKAIRGLTEFTTDEIAILTEAPHQAASRYVFLLYQSGYIRQAGTRKEADGRKRRVWRLRKNTGPKAPTPCRCLYDPNIDDLAEVKDVA